jgi:hypothetical protein
MEHRNRFLFTNIVIHGSKKNIYVRLISMFNPQIHVRFLSHRHLYLRSMSFFQMIKSMIGSHFPKSKSNDVKDICPKPTKDLRIWKGRRFENTLKSDRDLR